MKIELLYFKEMLREAVDSLGREDEIHEVEIRTQAEAGAIRFMGSPSIRINGSDIEPWARSAKGLGLSCRTYVNGSRQSGVPSRDLVLSAIMEGMREGN